MSIKTEVKQRKKLTVVGDKITVAFSSEPMHRLTMNNQDEVDDFVQWFDALDPIDPDHVDIFRNTITTYISPVEMSEGISKSVEMSALLAKIKQIQARYPEISLIEGRVCLDGIDVSMPEVIIREIIRRSQTDEDMQSLFNFWRWLILNPDPEAREGAFRFITDLNLSLTPEGFFVAYRSVVHKHTESEAEAPTIDFEETLDQMYDLKEKFRGHGLFEHQMHVWRVILDNGMEQLYINNSKTRAPSVSQLRYKKYKTVYPINNSYGNVRKYAKKLYNKMVGDRPHDSYASSEYVRILSKEVRCQYEGTYFDVLETLSNAKMRPAENEVFTDAHTHTMTIRMRTPVSMPRQDCDADPNVSCSRGLHVGSERFGIQGFGDKQIMCLINPQNIVAVPYEYGTGYKMRVCEYLPFDLVKRDKEGAIISPNMTLESEQSKDYCQVTKDYIKDLVKNTSAEELVNYQFNQVLNKADIKELMLNIRDKVLSRKSIL